jgi:hypothetical protein
VIAIDELQALPPGTRLVHIGPPKTGTTTLQAAFDRQRDTVLRQGVRYAGRRRHSRRAVIAVTATGPHGLQDPQGLREWQAIVDEVRSASEDRVLFSSERLAHAAPEAIRRVVEDLGGDRLHVAITLRPLARILPSQWQQAVQGGLVVSLDDWLRNVLAESPDNPRSFWHRHRHDRLVERWAAVTGAERVTVIVADDRDRSMLLRAFERLLALRDGTLELHRDLSNRSLTWPELEAVRALNRRFEAAGLSDDLHRAVVELGAIFRMRLRDPGADEPTIRLPAWAASELAPIARDIATGIERTGARVVGDPARLAEAEAASPGETDVDRGCTSPEVAGALAAGILAATGALGGESNVQAVPLRRLGGTVVRRVRRRVESRARQFLGGKVGA